MVPGPDIISAYINMRQQDLAVDEQALIQRGRAQDHSRVEHYGSKAEEMLSSGPEKGMWLRFQMCTVFNIISLAKLSSQCFGTFL